MGLGIGRGIGFPGGGSGSGTPGADAPVITGVPYKETAGGLIKFELAMSDGSKIPFNIPETALPTGPTEVTGTLGQAQDPRTMAAGKYYVTEKFVGAPTIAGSTYVGLLEIDDNYDNQNGTLLKYFNETGIFILKKLAGGWETTWQEFIKKTPVIIQPSNIKPAPRSDFNPDTEVLHGGFGGDWGDVIHYSNSVAGKPITITKAVAEAQYAYLSMVNAEASHVSGFTVDGGLPSQWESKKALIDGTEHTLFRSPFKFTKSPLTIDVVWS